MACKKTVQFSLLSDAQLDELVLKYIWVVMDLQQHKHTELGTLTQLGLARVDPPNTALKWGIVVSRRQYSVPWPNSLWHLDGHFSGSVLDLLVKTF